MLISFSGRNADALPPDDTEMWLTLATSVASPQGDPLSEEDKEFARAMEWAEEEDLDFGDEDSGPDDEDDDEPDEMSAAMAAVAALDHLDWLAVMSALITGGPGTPASAADLARYVSDFDPGELAGFADVDDEDDEDEADLEEEPDSASFGDFDDADDLEEFDEFDEFDELSVEGLFLHVTAMWSVLGAIDEDDRLTPLGWWGLPEAMQRAWSE